MRQPVRVEAISLPSEDGTREVDVSLIDWMLGLSPAQRLEVLEAHVALIGQLRRGERGE